MIYFRFEFGQKMTMRMHMVGAMYGASNFITLMMMVNFVSNDMDLKTKSGIDFNSTASGIGDASLMAMLKIFNQNRQSLHGNLGISIPTGSVDKKDDTPMMVNAQLGYPMQTGSGTWNPIVGFTWLGQWDHLSYGLQTNDVFPLGQNNHNYRIGNAFHAGRWLALRLSHYLSLSGSLKYYSTGSVYGEDLQLNPMMMPLMNAHNTGRDELQLGIGSNLLIPDGKFKNVRGAIEANLPVTQHVNGIQMEDHTIVTLGLQYTIEH